MTRVLLIVALGTAATTSAPGAVHAQLRWTDPGHSTPALHAAAGVPRQEGPGSPPSLAPAALSLLLPGAGQHRLGQGRKWVYAAVEVLGWAVFFERRHAGGEYRTRYRDFAWNEARIQTGPRVDGDFDYYETLSVWDASGAYDSDPVAAGVQPEPDPSTYNGSIWARAMQIFIPGGGPVPPTDPGYQSALAYYDDFAYPTSLLWDWSGAPAGRAELADLIEESDARFRHATTALGVVIANHLISAADAYLSARGDRSSPRLRLVPDVVFGAPAWSAVVSVRTGR